MAKRMLVIADSEALWTKRFLEHVAVPAGYEIVLFPIWGHKGKFDDFYRENNITVYIDHHTLPVIRHIPRVRMWARIFANARKLIAMGPFDVVHNHYISQRDLALGKLVSQKFGARWVASIWGSDFLRASNLEKQRMKPLLQDCDHVHVITTLIGGKVTGLCGKKTAKKMILVDFGQIGYQCIDNVLKTQDQAACKRYFGIDPDRFVLCIGYSASSAQQQLKVIEAMRKLPAEVFQKITIVLQQTYCMDDPAYVEATRKLASELPCPTVTMSEFMNDEDCARLRIAADAFVLAITTDAISSAMRDYLYAGACVIKGNWLIYPPLDELGIHLHEFGAFEEIPMLVEQAIRGEITGLSAEKRAVFPKTYGWEKMLPGWLSMYE